MKQGFYYSNILKGLYLLIHNNSLDKFDSYRVHKDSIVYITSTSPTSIIWKKANYIMPFDHIPSKEELEQLPELFI